MNYANLTTALRIALIPAILACYSSGLAQAHLLAAGLFAIASLTDWLDGFLARRLNQATELGAFLDPVADKLLVVVVLLVLLSAFPVLLPPVAIIVLRELIVSALREWTAGRGRRVGVAFLGKLKAAIQMLAITALLLVEDGGPAFPWLMGASLIHLSALLALWSMAQYFHHAWRTLRD